jgi:hypothetical protein
LQTVFVLVVVVAGCSGRRGFVQSQFGFPSGSALFGVMLLGIVGALVGWLYYRATR